MKEIRHPDHKILWQRIQPEMADLEWVSPSEEEKLVYKQAKQVHKARNQAPRSFKKALVKQVIREEIGF